MDLWLTECKSYLDEVVGARERRRLANPAQPLFRSAIANGGSEDGAPGLRPNYDSHYYGAFVRDPDGNKIEALTLLSK